MIMGFAWSFMLFLNIWLHRTFKLEYSVEIQWIILGFNADKISTLEWKTLCDRSQENIHSLVKFVYYAVHALLLAVKYIWHVLAISEYTGSIYKQRIRLLYYTLASLLTHRILWRNPHAQVRRHLCSRSCFQNEPVPDQHSCRSACEGSLRGSESC